MKARTHTCAAPGCTRQVPHYLLMCIDHWRMVPAPLARAVSNAYAATRAAASGTGQLQAARAHQLAVQQAVDAVAAKLDRKASEAAAGSGDLFTN